MLNLMAMETQAGAECVPRWVTGFVQKEYFTECHDHDHHSTKSRATDPSSTKKGDRNYYCVDCAKGPLCETSRQVEHRGHRVLQVRKASHTDAIRVNDIAKLLNIDHIQTYTINGAKIVFLPSRPQAKPAKGSPNYCEVCNRSLQDFVRFCSVTCKMKFVGSRPSDPFVTLTGGMHCSDQELQSISGDAMGMNDVLRPPSPSPSIPAKKRARSLKKECIPSPLRDASLQMLDTMQRAEEQSPISVIPETVVGAESPNSLESLDRFQSFRKKIRKGVPVRAPGVGIAV